MERVAVIIVAGGSGSRMGAAIPKQFLPLRGVPILVRTLRLFLSALPEARIVVTLPAAETERWRGICAAEGLSATHTVCPGGATRFESVRRGLEATGPCDLIAVHDGVRPLASTSLVRRCILTAARHGTAVPVVAPADSFRIMEGESSRPVDRSALRAVQTPQVFRAYTLRAAYGMDFRPEYTDDASVVEAAGTAVTLCEGERGNIKITTPEDLAVAEALLAAVQRG